jgi:hypothetical protein
MEPFFAKPQNCFMMVINNKFEIGDTVYLITDKEQEPRLVTELIIRPGGLIVYGCSLCQETSEHYDFELSKEKDYVNN